MDPSLSALLRQFFALTAVNTLEIPPDVTFQDLNHVLVQLLTDPHFREYAPSTQYQQQFWKWVIQRLEEMAKDEEIFLILTIYVCLYQGQVSEEAEIDLLIYEHYLSLRHQTQAGPYVGHSFAHILYRLVQCTGLRRSDCNATNSRSRLIPA